MATPQAPVAREAQTNGGGTALADVVLKAPEHGSGYFFPATAPGTPLALAAFGSSLAMLSMGNAEVFSLGALLIVAPVAFGFGAVGMILAGMWDFRGGAAFHAMWETAYGCFWLFLGLQLAVFGDDIVRAAGASGAADAFGAYLLVWAVLTAGFTVGTYYIARPAFVAFVMLTAVFLFVGIANLSAPGDTADTLRQIGGWIGIANAAVALYLSFALMINPMVGRTVMPVWAYPYKKD